jgi:hypothetical protein
VKLNRIQWAQILCLLLPGFYLFVTYLVQSTDDPRTGLLGLFLLVVGIYGPQQENLRQRLGKVEKQLEELRTKVDSPAR